jgi:hypothetical protein
MTLVNEKLYAASNQPPNGMWQVVKKPVIIPITHPRGWNNIFPSPAQADNVA